MLALLKLIRLCPSRLGLVVQSQRVFGGSWSAEDVSAPIHAAQLPPPLLVQP